MDLSVVRRIVGSAERNARRSLEDIAAAVRDRGATVPGMSDDHGDLARLPKQVCLELLESRSTGRLAYIARAGVPDVLPVNYVLAGESILLRSAPGPKLQAAERRERVAFEVDDIDDASHRGWSVVISGTAERLSPTHAARLPVPVPWASGPRHHTVRIHPHRIEGRRLF